MKVGMETWSALRFRRELYSAVERFKKENPGVLEARTEARRKRQKREGVIIDAGESEGAGEG